MHVRHYMEKKNKKFKKEMKKNIKPNLKVVNTVNNFSAGQLLTVCVCKQAVSSVINGALLTHFTSAPPVPSFS